LNKKEPRINKEKIDLKKNQFSEIHEDKDEEMEIPGCDNEKKEIEFQKLKKQKKDLNIEFHQIQDQMTPMHTQIKNEYTYAMNYSNYLESLNNQIMSLRQQLRISVIGTRFNFGNMTGDKMNKLSNEMELTYNLINQIKETINKINNRTLKKAENMLRNIQTNLNEIDNKKKLSYDFLSIKIDSIINYTEDLKKLCKVINKAIEDMKSKRKEIEKNISI
jgi:exonuclease VII large subunit